MTPAPPADSDLWHGYGAGRFSRDRRRGATGRLYWDWYQRTGPGAELLGDVTGRVVLDLGAGSGRQAAHLAERLAPARVIAVDASPSQHERARARYGHIPRLVPVQSDATAYLRQHPGGADVCYSAFGACDFTDPRLLLPAVAAALRPGGRLLIATLARYRDGSPPETDVRPARITARAADGTPTTMERWVLGTPVWEKLLAEAGFTVAAVKTIRDDGEGDDAGPPMTTTVLLGHLT
ncbi:class I SAM-dependent methyltransferase [Streptomyces sp. JJ36]|uniref:class I SAM-dependent methyltransferase n=1 Tax=Streptomyces sp. JJ36 TaxID=2736645 RepID=UPI001F2ABFC0|nr:class I SAM-dependent methyltransferase [Streptomyces sp. JJ36]